MAEPTNALAVLKGYMTNIEVQGRLKDMLGKRAGAFTNSLLNIYRNSKALQKCSPDSIMSAAMVAASLALPIEPALGQAAIVGYGNKAQFQIMYKGVTQLCIRSGKYLTIHCTQVYSDEIVSFNPITGEVKFKNLTEYKLRNEGLDENVVGHYASFELLSGFRKADYMTCGEAIAHAKKYSKAYQYDLRDKKRTSKWSTDPVPMANKTVLLRLLTKYGIMSVEMQDALVADHEDFEASQRQAEDSNQQQAGSETVTEFEPEQKPCRWRCENDHEFDRRKGGKACPECESEKLIDQQAKTDGAKQKKNEDFLKP